MSCEANWLPEPARSATTLVQLLRARAQQSPDDLAHAFLRGGLVSAQLTYGELDRVSRSIAAELQALVGLEARVILAFPPGLDYVAAFMGCLYAGLTAVPVYPPDPARLSRTLPRFIAIVKDAAPAVLLTDRASITMSRVLQSQVAELEGVPIVAVDAKAAGDESEWQPPRIDGESVAFLQYTSGSTGRPKGVMVRQRNLLHNLAYIDYVQRRPGARVGLTWLPSYHDMGLIEGLLEPLFLGYPGYIMSPLEFLKDPGLWLDAITRFRVTNTGGPNFSYDLCVRKVPESRLAEFDLSSLAVVYSGAEPIRAETIDRFNEKFGRCGFPEDAWYPVYGLAEATLMVSSRKRDMPFGRARLSSADLALGRVVQQTDEDQGGRVHVSSGRTGFGVEVVIVDPESCRVMPSGDVGEIWVGGPSVTSGYWNRPQETADACDARTAAGDGPFLRTGDLGFVDDQGELFVTGRLKDLIIIRGRNLYPQDIEHTAESSHEALRRGCCVAVGVERAGDERLIVICEVERRYHSEPSGSYLSVRVPKPEVDAFSPDLASSPRLAQVADAIRQAVATEQGVAPAAIVLIKAGSLFKTTSGKVQRRKNRQAFLSGQLQSVHRWDEQQEPAGAPSVAVADDRTDSLRRWITDWLSDRLRVPAERIDPTIPPAHYGLDSQQAVELVAALEQRVGRPLPATLMWDYPSIEALCRYLAQPAPAASRRKRPSQGLASRPSIAIIGMACRFPAGDGATAYWQLLTTEGSGIGDVPRRRWDPSRLHQTHGGQPEQAVWSRGGFLADVEGFDPSFFGISPREASAMDPQQRVMLELAWEALEDAGQLVSQLKESRTGVFIGISAADYSRLLFVNPRAIDAYSGPGASLSASANRISYQFDLRGPSMAVDTACSSSLVAVHLACESLRRGESSMAVAGGVNLLLMPEASVALDRAGVLSPTGYCHTFGADADGYVRSEGAGAVVLKSVEAALADGDPIYAVLRGGAIGSEGRTNGLMAPSGPAQSRLVREALGDAGIAASQVDYVEAHGTATAMGDPIEVQGLAEVVGVGRQPDQPCRIGSVKSNIGHLEAAAGVAGLIKVALAIHHRQIPASLNAARPNPHIPFDKLPVVVQKTLQPWPDRGTATAGVSSFGFGGSIAHLLLQEPPSGADQQQPSRIPRTLLLPVSAHDERTLRARARAMAQKLLDSAGDRAALGDICHTAAARRTHHAVRLAATAADAAGLREQLLAYATGAAHGGVATPRVGQPASGRLAWVFCGQGAQWWGMARSLLTSEAAFRESLERCDAVYRELGGDSLLEDLTRDQQTSRVDETFVAQPLLVAIQIALAELWRSWGIEPDAVVGHSLGEIAAAWTAGVLTLEDSMRVAYHRGRLLENVSGRGSMAAAELDAKEAQALAAETDARIEVAVINGPRAVVLSGEKQALVATLERLQERGVFCRHLRVGFASHCAQMQPVATELAGVLQGIACRKPEIPFFSSADPDNQVQSLFDARYWAFSLRNPVRFHGAVEQALAAGYDTWLEISPHPVLSASIAETARVSGQQVDCFASLHRERGDHEALLATLGQLYVRGWDPAWDAIAAGWGRCISLPAYPWQREAYWVTEDRSRSYWQQASAKQTLGEVSGLPNHPVLTQHIDLASEPSKQLFQGEIAERDPWVRGHRVAGSVLVPAAGFVELALSAARMLGWPLPLQLEDLCLEQALALAEDTRAAVQIELDLESETVAHFRISSRAATRPRSPWRLHARGRLVAAEGSQAAARDLLEARSATAETALERESFYGDLLADGLDYQGEYRRIVDLWRDGKQVTGRLAEDRLPEADRGVFHPAVLDAAFQLIGAAVPRDEQTARGGRVFVPAGAERIACLADPSAARWARARLVQGSLAEDEIRGEVQLFCADERLLVHVDGLRVQAVDSRALQPSLPSPRWLHGVEWKAIETPQSPASAPGAVAQWLVFADEAELGPELCAELAKHGHRALLVTPAADFQLVDGNTCRISPVQPEHYDRLLAHAARSEAPIRIAHLWSESPELAPEAPGDPRCCPSAFFLAQALDRIAVDPPVPSWFITRGAQRVLADQPSLQPQQAALSSLLRSLRNERLLAPMTVVDLDPVAPASAQVGSVVQALLAGAPEEELAVRAGAWFAPRLQVLPSLLGAAADGWTAREDGAYLITGGWGYIGSLLREWLITRGARHIVIFSNDPASAEQRKQLERAQSRAVNCSLHEVDLADKGQVDAALAAVRASGLSLRGVFHAAGVLEDATLSNLDLERFRRVMGPKANGAWYLDQATRSDPIEQFVLFSSAAAVLGSPGQSLYCAANGYLDGLAASRRARGLPGLAVSWGPWAGGGMADQPGTRRSQMPGIRAIGPAAAFEVLGSLLACGHDPHLPPAPMVLPVDWGLLLREHSVARRRRLYADMLAVAGPRATMVSEAESLPSPGASSDEYLAYVVGLVARALQSMPQKVDPDMELTRLGVDSLMASELRAAVAAQLSVELRVADLLREGTARRIAAVLERSHGKPADHGSGSAVEESADQLLERVDEMAEEEVERLLEELS